MMQTQAPKPLQHNGFSAAKTVAAQQIQTARVFSQVKARRTSEPLWPFSLDRSRVSPESVVPQRFSRLQSCCAATTSELPVYVCRWGLDPLWDKDFGDAGSVVLQHFSAVTEGEVCVNVTLGRCVSGGGMIER